jgi:hypothetical protein
MNGEFDRLLRAVGAGASDHRNAAIRRLDADFHDAVVLGMR